MKVFRQDTSLLILFYILSRLSCIVFVNLLFVLIYKGRKTLFKFFSPPRRKGFRTEDHRRTRAAKRRRTDLRREGLVSAESKELRGQTSPCDVHSLHTVGEGREVGVRRLEEFGRPFVGSGPHKGTRWWTGNKRSGDQGRSVTVLEDDRVSTGGGTTKRSVQYIHLEFHDTSRTTKVDLPYRQ